MISPLLPIHDADTVALDFGVFVARRARTYRCSREAIIAAVLETIPLTPPSQPGETSRSHAPAAQTDGGGLPSLGSQPSVDLSGLAAHEQGPHENPEASGVTTSDPQRSEAAAHEDADAGASGDMTGQPVEPLGSAAPAAPRRITNRQRVRECHQAHPDWTAEQIAADTGLGAQQVRVIASQTSLKLPKPSPAEPQEAVEPPPAPEAQPEPEQPPANTAVARTLPLPPPVVKPMQKGPQGRFYLRDKTTLAFVHQSLAPAKDGSGPMMTGDRKWAWYDTMERFKGAVRKWPELASMRKEAAAK